MKILSMFLKHLSSRKGNSSIIFLGASVLFIGMLVFITDAGMIYLEKSRLQNASDAIALAAMQDYEKGETAMLAQAYKYADLNKVDPAGLVITVSNNNKQIMVIAKKKVSMHFAQIFSMSDIMVQTKSTARVGAVVATNGIRPLAIEQQDFVFGQTYTLKKGAGSGYTGNYGALALGGTGSSNYKSNLMYGYNTDLKIGDLVRLGEDLETEPGNMAGPTYDGIRYILNQDTNSHSDLSKLEKNCPRLIVIPVVDSLDVAGRTTVKIVGFANFFLEDVTYDGGQTEVKGKFIRTLGQGDIDFNAAGFGLTGIKLVE